MVTRVMPEWSFVRIHICQSFPRIVNTSLWCERTWREEYFSRVRHSITVTIRNVYILTNESCRSTLRSVYIRSDHVCDLVFTHLLNDSSQGHLHTYVAKQLIALFNIGNHEEIIHDFRFVARPVIFIFFHLQTRNVRCPYTTAAILTRSMS